MNSFFGTRFGKWLLFGSIIVIVVTVVSGLFIDKGGFPGNLLAEITGLALGVLATVLIVERFLQHQRKERWKRVRNLTYFAIANHLCDLVTEIFTYFPLDDHRPMSAIIEGRNHPNPLTIKAMEELISQMKDLPEAVSPEKSTSDIAVDFYEKIRWDIEQLRNVLLPRVIQSSEDQALIDKLTEFDNRARDLYNSILIHLEAVTHSVFPSVRNLVESAKSVYSELLLVWNPPKQ